MALEDTAAYGAWQGLGLGMTVPGIKGRGSMSTSNFGRYGMGEIRQGDGMTHCEIYVMKCTGKVTRK
jgi:hypothetical protein